VVDRIAMDRDAFDALVATVLDDLPEWVREAFDNISIVIEDEPDPELGPDAEGLLGLYTGTPLPERDSSYAGALPDVIYIFRQPHLELDVPEAALGQEIAKTVLHEVAHYFGLDDDYLEQEGWG
jgi:predicted Zn-dependent protease with MMP-like domain